MGGGSDVGKGKTMNERRSLSGQLEKAWGQALLAVSAVEEEASCWVHRWAEAAGWSPDDARRQAAEWTERLAGQRRDLERFMDEGVRKAMSRLSLPKREEVQLLEQRLGSLSSRIERLQEEER